MPGVNIVGNDWGGGGSPGTDPITCADYCSGINCRSFTYDTNS